MKALVHQAEKMEKHLKRKGAVQRNSQNFNKFEWRDWEMTMEKLQVILQTERKKLEK
ncbi:hypothetical protein SESBI_07765 [Sesbania bispinosa]|nr:hypothetical protein SESBI_07765 [Sesbania bispinosa]